MNRWSRLALAAALVAGAACAGGGQAGDREFRDFNMLTYEQIQEVRASNAYDIVQRLRSRWLRGYGSTQLPGGGAAGDFVVQVYLDEVHLGGVARLREISYQEISYIRYLSPSEASSRWGFNHGAGAIMVYTDPVEEQASG
jgi:hypothetical protein